MNAIIFCLFQFSTYDSGGLLLLHPVGLMVGFGAETGLFRWKWEKGVISLHNFVSTLLHKNDTLLIFCDFNLDGWEIREKSREFYMLWVRVSWSQDERRQNQTHYDQYHPDQEVRR